MAFTHTLFSTAKTYLAERLGDTGKVYWTDTELGLYIKEALQTWGMLTGYWRDTGLVSTVSGTAFYDISTLQNSAVESLLSYTTTDTDLTTVIQYHLLEPATGTTWTGSEQFTLADVTGALTRRRDMLLVEADARISRSTQAIASADRTFTMPQTTLALKRLAWTNAAGSTTYALFPEDINSQRNYSTSFLNTPDIPISYSSASVEPIEFVIAPPPNQDGTLDYLVVQSGATLTAQGVAVGVPDDMCWVVKWGAMADLLGREGPGQDLSRSYFCERRYRMGIELAKVYPTVINAQINGIDLSLESIASLDRYNVNWQSTTAVPQFVASLRNYIAVANAPNAIFSIRLDVVRKAPLPTGDNTYIQIGKEYLNSILDYAEHIAAFKCGGEEFRHTLRAADSFFAAALSYNQRLAATNPGLVELIRQSMKDDYVLPPEKNTGNRPLMTRAQGSEEIQ